MPNTHLTLAPSTQRGFLVRLQPATEAAALDTVCSLDSMAIAAEEVDAKMVEVLPVVDEGVLPVGAPMAATPTTSIAQFLDRASTRA